jgi:hypothetical protein
MWYCTDEEIKDAYQPLKSVLNQAKNDIRYARYVNSINFFISKFGRERLHLVGSTDELSKLAYSKDDGDADFLLVSGKLEIPVENLVQNK